MGPPQIANWSVTGHPSEILGFSPSLFSSPGKLPPEQILEDSTEFLTQGEHLGLDLTLGPFRKHMVILTKCAALGPGCISSRPHLQNPVALWGSGPGSPSARGSLQEPTSGTYSLRSAWRCPRGPGL